MFEIDQQRLIENDQQEICTVWKWPTVQNSMFENDQQPMCENDQHSMFENVLHVFCMFENDQHYVWKWPTSCLKMTNMVLTIKW